MLHQRSDSHRNLPSIFRLRRHRLLCCFVLARGSCASASIRKEKKVLSITERWICCLRYSTVEKSRHFNELVLRHFQHFWLKNFDVSRHFKMFFLFCSEFRSSSSPSLSIRRTENWTTCVNNYVINSTGLMRDWLWYTTEILCLTCWIFYKILTKHC